MHKEKHFSLSELSEKLKLKRSEYHDYEYPQVSIIVPTLNSASHLSITLDSLLSMQYIDYEIVIVDGGSKDRTLPIIKGYRSERIRLFSISECTKYEMLNKGVSEAKGQYIGFLFPGDYYLSPHTFSFIFTEAIREKYPEFLYSGTVIRDARGEVKMLYRKFSASLLRKGLQPTSLQACFFHQKIFLRIGKFSPSLSIRGGFDLFCRIAKDPDIRIGALSRIFIDYVQRVITKDMVIDHFVETLYCINKYYGPWHAFIWIFRQKDLMRLMRILRRSFFLSLGIQQ